MCRYSRDFQKWKERDNLRQDSLEQEEEEKVVQKVRIDSLQTLVRSVLINEEWEGGGRGEVLSLLGSIETNFTAAFLLPHERLPC